MWFNQMADEDKRKVEMETQQVVNITVCPFDKLHHIMTVPFLWQVTKKKKVKRMKDPNAPKRALSGFFWFSNEERPKVQAANPDFKVRSALKTHTNPN